MTEQMKEAILKVVVSDVDMPAFGAYEAQSARFGEAQVFLNLALIYTAAAACDEPPAKLMAETTVHELLHALQGVYGQTFSESDIETLLAQAQGYEVDVDDGDDRHGEMLSDVYGHGYLDGVIAASKGDIPGLEEVDGDDGQQSFHLFSVVQWERYRVGMELDVTEVAVCVAGDWQLMPVDFLNDGDVFIRLPKPPEGMA